MPVLNGQTADFVLKGALGLLFALIVGVGLLTANGNQIPTEYTTLIGALIGVIVGSRVVPTDVSARIKTEHEREIQADVAASEVRNGK